MRWYGQREPYEESYFLNFVLVPLAAMGTAYRYINRGRDGVS
jgi:hypothetical protein